MNFTFLPGSIVGFVDYPEALFVRSLASGLANAGHQVRVVEQRRNPFIEATLRREGADVYRHVYTEYPTIQFHTYEPRTGPRLLEWVSREMALSDVIVAVNGIPQELCRWIGNLEQPGSVRIFMSYRPQELTETFIHDYEIDKFEAVLSTAETAGSINTILFDPSIAAVDEAFASTSMHNTDLSYTFVSAEVGAEAFLIAVQNVTRQSTSATSDSNNGSTPQPQATRQIGVGPLGGEQTTTRNR